MFASTPSESGFRSPAADRYKLPVERFERHLSHLTELREVAVPFSLTFDDGGESFYSQVADRLERRHWRAHCFVPTDFIDRPGFLTRGQIRDLDARGHQIGAHSASHPARISACASPVLHAEWRESVAVLEDLLGHAVTMASVPGGYYSPAVAAAATAAGIRLLFTSEPVTRMHEAAGCVIAGRFAIRQHNADTLSARLVAAAPWARMAMWADWNVKAICKPVLGPAYSQVANRLMALRSRPDPPTTPPPHQHHAITNLEEQP